MSERLYRVRLVRQFVEPLGLEDVPEELRELFVIPEGRNYVDVEVPEAGVRAIRDLADKRFWSLNEGTQAADIRAAHVTRTLCEAKLR
ncbi:hypothetical protein [Streptomyces sp. NPDC001089]